MYRTIIVDDERLAREEVKRALSSYPEFVIVGEASNVEEALVKINSEKVDLLFLDIHMPEKSGFDLLEELSTVPEVVFTTAYNQYAVQAFEVNALDYLVKPIRDERFAKAIEKVKQRLSKVQTSKEPLDMQSRIFIKEGEQCYFIPLAEIHFIESLENYARLHFGAKKVLIKRSLNLLEEKLPNTAFFRINRSQMVNINYIERLYPHFKNRLNIVLKTGETLEVSSRQSAKFKNWTAL